MGRIAEVIRKSIPLLTLYTDDNDQSPTGWHIYTCNAIAEKARELFPLERRRLFRRGPAEDWYFNWLHEFMFFGNSVPLAFYESAEEAIPIKERQEIRLMLLCFAALQAEDDGV